jgi:hypothetical protein
MICVKPIPLICNICERNQGGDCWDVRQCFVQQFKTEYVRLLEGLVFEKKSDIIYIYIYIYRERERKRERERERLPALT